MKTKLFLIITTILTCNVFAHGVSDSDKVELIKGGLIDYLYLGAKHMVTGYDHILFLVGVMFFLTKFSDIAKFITAFTLGHSITLIFATYFEVNANYYLIDAVIALSVIYKGFENLDGFKKWFSVNAPSLVLMVFLFGLIHGFGLSTRLQQLPLGDDDLLSKIISFNVGVELGQIAILALIFPAIKMLRGDGFAKFSKITNSGLVLAGIFLFVFQLYGYMNTSKDKELKGMDDKELLHSPKENLHEHHHHGSEKSHRH